MVVMPSAAPRPAAALSNRRATALLAQILVRLRSNVDPLHLVIVRHLSAD
jgi:hypothetical protein